MNSLYFVLVIVIVIHSGCCNSEDVVARKLNLTVYIESECYYSTKFFDNQLKPNYNEFKDKINIRYVTFALATVIEKYDGNFEISCFHGPSECEINFFQACALHVHSDNQLLQNKIIFCTMDVSHEYSDCINELQLKASEIESCSSGALGKSLARAMQQEFASVAPILRGVPTVVYNDQVNRAEAVNSRRNLREVLVRKLNIDDESSENEDD